MPVDSASLSIALRRKGKSLQDISGELGYSLNYISSTVNSTGGLPVAFIKYIETVYGIEHSEYSTEHESESGISQSRLEKSIENVLSGYQPIDYERLYKVIYSATYEAMAKALKGE